MRSTLRWLPAVLAVSVLACGVSAAADEAKPLERKELDKRLATTVLKDVTNLGVDQFNSGDWAGCYHTFKAMLLSIEPVLDHRPDLQKLIQDSIQQSDEMPVRWQAAKALREDTIDVIRVCLYEGLTIPQGRDRAREIRALRARPETKPTTLFGRIGGDKGATKIADVFILEADRDAVVNLSRDGKYRLDDAALAKLKGAAAEILVTETGGKKGKGLVESLKEFNITEDEYKAGVAVLTKVLKFSGVADADAADVLKIVEGAKKDIVVSKPPEPKPEPKPEAKPEPKPEPKKDDKP